MNVNFKYKTEFFLFSSILFAVLNIQNLILHIFIVIFILKFFTKNKSFIALSVLILFTTISLNYSAIIIDKSVHYGSLINYKTTKGIYKSKENIEIGTILLAKFEIQDKGFYKFIKPETKPLKIKLPFIFSILKFRKDMSEKFYFLSAGELSLPQALLFGDKSYLTTETKDIFTLLGLNHLLAVSGMHVGLLILIIYFISIKLPLKFRYILISIFLSCFIFLAGLKIPVLRSTLFTIIIFSALFLDTKTNLKKLLLFVASIFILISPNTIKDISFILSFSAVFGIIYMLEKNKNPIYSLFLTGIVATAFTLPSVLYFFGMFNILSIVNTIILLPFIYLILLTSLFGLIFTKLSIAPLLFIERMINYIIKILIKISDYTFIVDKIDLTILIIMIVILFISLYYKKVYLLLLLFLIPFVSIQEEKFICFPNLGRSKAIIQVSDISSIYFLGNHSDFRYKLLPYLAKLKIRKFDYGRIKIFGGKNYFIKIKQSNLKFKGICINKENESCRFVYKTKSNSIFPANIDYNKKYIIYKNGFKSDNIYELSKIGDLIIYENKIK